jgi:molybdopterin molybdotransferase
MISPSEAEAAIRTHAPSWPAVVMPLADLGGTVLREAVVATRDQPPFDRVTMDGIALSTAAYERGRRTFRIAGTQAAGAAPLTLEDPDACLEVMTGAMCPVGCDCVIPVENIAVRDGTAHLLEQATVARRLNIHVRGLDSRLGDALLQPGTRLGPAEVAVLAANGRTSALVTCVPRIMVISTGDELIEPGQATEDWQIWRSNAYAVVTALRRRGYAHVAQDHVPDDLATLRTRLRAHLDSHDVLVLSGGVSMGRFDYIPQVLDELGVRVVFHKVSQRPGKPMWFGVSTGGKAVYALPGNPVSTLICLVRYVLPGLEAASGAPTTSVEQVALGEPFEVKVPLTTFTPVLLTASGVQRAALPRPTRGSGDFISLVGTHGFVELPPGPRVFESGTPAGLYCW